jgi:type IV pilus assembly protein PilB
MYEQLRPGSTKSLFFHGAGCADCANTGYRDRIGVYELLRITPKLRQLIVDHATTEQVRQAAIDEGMRPMIEEALNLVDNDVTTISEVVRTLYVG